MRTLRLESFACADEVLPMAEEVAPDTEARLATYEEGYAAGWEDAAAAQREDRAQLDDEIARALAATGYTLQEARQQILHALRPLLEAIATQIVPAAARQSLPALVVETLLPLAEERVAAPVVIRLHPSARGTVEAHLTRLSDTEFTVAEDAALSPGQVVLSAGPAGARIDLDAVADEIAAAIRDFHDIHSTEHLHG